jgi:oxygen-independent coproporphyrinogen-3 oxidase
MTQSLIPINLISNIECDSSVLADNLRCYGFYPVSDQTAALTLSISWSEEEKTVMLHWSQGSSTYTQTAAVKPITPDDSFAETKEYRRRRILRLALHKLIADNNLARPNPWGILTGVRPTKMIHRFLDQGFSLEKISNILKADYAVEKPKIDLLLSTVLYQRPYLLSKQEALRKISIYLSFPFCPSRCSYCSFPGYDINKWRKRVQACIDAMLQEIKALGTATKSLGLQVQTFYFGGGTPTSMSPEDMDTLLNAVEDSFNFTADSEWTIEGGRPETLTESMLNVLGKHPVDRLCINPQTMQQQTLDQIHRKHSVTIVEEAFQRVRQTKCLENCLINSDLILGLPGEGLPELAQSLERLLVLAPENITLHCLAIKRGSEYKENQPEMLTGDQAAALGELAHSRLRAAGYVPYYLYRQKDMLARGENVGYCLPGKHSLYNIHMMEERQIIMGLGVGSCSKFINRNDWTLENMYNPKDLIQYITRIEELIQRKVDKLGQIV